MSEKSEKTEQEEEKVFEEWLCTSVWVTLASKVRGAAWRRIREDGSLADTHYSDYKGHKRIKPFVGGVFRIRVDGKRKGDDPVDYYPNSLHYSYLWPNEVERIAWEASDIANEAEIIAVKEANKGKQQTVNDILETLRPLRKMYHRTNAVGRVALEVQLLTWLRKYDPDREY